MTLNEFEQRTFALQNKEDRDLETYLLALLNLVEQNKNKVANPELLLELLATAFTATPLALDSTWLNIKSAPETTEEQKRMDAYRTPNKVAENYYVNIHNIGLPLDPTDDVSSGFWCLIPFDPQAAPDLFAGRSFDGIDYAIAVLQFQVAELHKMKGKQLADQWRSMGIDSETGNRWYNFDPISNISCGVRWFLDAGDEDDIFDADWETLGHLLEMGRIYE